jgi:predicted RNase H-like nuclease (RuvC/YqgF family)
MSVDKNYCKAFLEQLSRIADTNTYLRIENSKLKTENIRFKKNIKTLENELALIKQPPVSKNTSLYDPMEDIIWIIF